MNKTDLTMIDPLFQSQKDFFATHQTKNVTFRLSYLKKLKSWIKLHENEISDALYTDLNKSPEEAFLSEIGIILDELSIHIKKVKKWTKLKTVLPALNNFPARSYTIAEPYGVILNIAPWNYPFLLAIQPLIGMISAGNTAILKPSEMAPATATLMEKMLSDIFPSNYVAIVQGDKEAAQTLLKLPFDYIFYTGNPAVGKIIMKAAAEHLTPVTLELGGKSPVIVHEDANINTAAKRIAWGKCINAGQTCIAPDYLFVHKSIKDKMIEKIGYYINVFYGKNIEKSNFAHIINDRHFTRLFSYLEGQNILWGGECNSKKRYLAPTLIDEPNPKSPLMQEEIFGPLLPVISYENIDEVLKFINARPKPLALYLFTTSNKIIKKFTHESSSGALTVNDTLMHLGNHRLPFGGVGNSGMGSYRGQFSFDTFSHKKAVMINSNYPDIPVRYAPYNTLKNTILRLFLK